MDQIAPLLFKVANLKMELTVDLRPFTHKVDDAFPLHKASLSIIGNLPVCLDIAASMAVPLKALANEKVIPLQRTKLLSVCDCANLLFKSIGDPLGKNWCTGNSGPSWETSWKTSGIEKVCPPHHGSPAHS
jgi:hypothetical protein